MPIAIFDNSSPSVMRSDDSSSLWLPLLRTLTETSTHWGVLKNADRALEGMGDIDSVAPREDWAQLERCHRDWASSNGAIATIACTHTPGLLILLAVLPGQESLLQLDLFSDCYWRGSTLFSARQLGPLMTKDPRGFRRVRPGAEGVVLLLLNGTRWGARPDTATLLKRRVPDLLREDPEGVAATARVLGAPRVLSVASAVQNDEWATTSILSLEVRALARSLLWPRELVGRILWRSRAHARVCPVDRALDDDRRIPADLDTWFRSIEAQGTSQHQVVRF